ncbi:MAG TPA: peptidoglycan bridge formation glycyltransferase FemA/FemB family protein [Bryobacteraceae bacterium]|nr:peptidoglycan bridge formation glycyltransferase FemA/FemB family protein [Bryobacteraceae bacterium]
MSSVACASDRWTAWDDFLETVKETGFMQSSLWCDFCVCRGFEYFGAVLKDRDEILGGAIVLKRAYSEDSCFYYIQDGPVLTSDDEPVREAVFDALFEELNRRRERENETVSHLRIEPRWTRMPEFLSNFRLAPDDDDYIEPRRTLYVDLRNSEAAILGQMKPKGRYNVRLAAKHGVSVVQDTSESGLADFLRIYRETASRHEIHAKPQAYFATLFSMFSPSGRARIFFAEYRGARVASALVMYFGRRATYFFGGSLHTHRNVMAPYLLHFEIMRSAKAAGYEWYDMWGIAAADDTDDPWYDISLFKRKFGGVEIELVPTLDYVYDEDAYSRYLHPECEE